MRYVALLVLRLAAANSAWLPCVLRSSFSSRAIDDRGLCGVNDITAPPLAPEEKHYNFGVAAVGAALLAFALSIFDGVCMQFLLRKPRGGSCLRCATYPTVVVCTD